VPVGFTRNYSEATTSTNSDLKEIISQLENIKNDLKKLFDVPEELLELKLQVTNIETELKEISETVEINNAKISYFIIDLI
jgi:hypothetical protein